MPPRKPTEQRLDELVRKKDQLDAQIAALGARTGTERRKIENRAVWLLGRLLRDNLAEDRELFDWVRRELPPKLSERDRANGVWELIFPDGDEEPRQ